MAFWRLEEERVEKRKGRVGAEETIAFMSFRRMVSLQNSR